MHGNPPGATKTRPQVHGNPLAATKTSPPPYAREPIGSDHKLDPKCTGTHQERRKVGVSEGEDTGQPNYSERTQNKSVEFAKVGRRGASAATLHRLGISRTQNQSVQFARVWFLS